MTDKELIKQEIEKRLSSLWDLIPEGEKVLKDDFTREDANNLGRYTELESLLKFINSLPEEPVSEDLEEEIDKFEDWANNFNQSDYPTSYTVRDIARHFTEWQKQQMMKDAVDATVHKGLYGSKYIKEQDDDVLNKALEKYNSGDKVKIMVVKEEQ